MMNPHYYVAEINIVWKLRGGKYVKCGAEFGRPGATMVEKFSILRMRFFNVFDAGTPWSNHTLSSRMF